MNIPATTSYRNCTLRRHCLEVHTVNHSARSTEKISPSIFSFQDGLCWHLHTLHCKQSLLSKVSGHCAELALFMLALLHAQLTKISH